MTIFWVLSALLLLLAVWFVVSAFFQKTMLSDADQNKQNIDIAKEQLNIIEKEKEVNQISSDEYQQRKEELQKGLVDNVDYSNDDVDTKKISPKYALLFSLVIISLISLPSYFYLGRSDALSYQPGNNQQASGAQQHAQGVQGMALSMEEALKKLSEKLKQNPKNVKGWQMLGRSYMSLNRYKEAAEAYENLYRQVGDDVPVLLAYADALAMSRDGKISGLPFQLVKTALEKKPDSTTGLWLAGLGYSEKGDFKNAINSWQQLLPLMAGNTASEDKIKRLIDQANAKLGLPDSAAATKQVSKPKDIVKKASINVTVSLDEKLRKSVKPTDVVFIYAKAHTGPPMPLAAVRQSVSGLPVTVTLDDSMAMMPQMKLSSFSVVDVGARISKSGSAIGQTGDLRGIVESVQLNATSSISIVINSIKP